MEVADVSVEHWQMLDLGSVYIFAGLVGKTYKRSQIGGSQRDSNV